MENFSRDSSNNTQNTADHIKALEGKEAVEKLKRIGKRRRKLFFLYQHKNRLATFCKANVCIRC